MRMISVLRIRIKHLVLDQRCTSVSFVCLGVHGSSATDVTKSLGVSIECRAFTG